VDLKVLVVLASRLMTDEVHDRLRAAGYDDLRPAHFFAFQVIASPGGATGGEIADHLGVTRQAASQLVAELDRLGYVERRDDPDDARRQRIVLSSRGRAALRRSAGFWAELEADWEQLVGPRTMAEMRRGLEAFVLAHGDPETPLRLRPTW
jgi:DNA-binding MarR family transcriptional regulator